MFSIERKEEFPQEIKNLPNQSSEKLKFDFEDCFIEKSDDQLLINYLFYY